MSRNDAQLFSNFNLNLTHLKFENSGSGVIHNKSRRFQRVALIAHNIYEKTHSIQYERVL